MGPGTADESFEGQQGCGSRLASIIHADRSVADGIG
jgi:hypothetical protein